MADHNEAIEDPKLDNKEPGIPTSTSSKSRPDTLSQEDLTCRYSPINWKLQGYDPIEEYKYFDGTPDSADQRFLIDLDTDSMEGLYDVRPYLYGMGYWYDEMTNSVPAHKRLANEDDVAQSDLAIEAYYVRTGRAFLRAEREKGHGYFLDDRDWSKYNNGDAETMPYCGPCGDLRGDVGFDDARYDFDDDLVDMERALLKTSVRTPLPDREVIKVEIGGEKWETCIQWLYLYPSHPVYKIVRGHAPSMEQVKFDRAFDGWQEGYLIEEAMYLYPNPYSMIPCVMPPAEAREYLDEQVAMYRELRRLGEI